MVMLTEEGVLDATQYTGMNELVHVNELTLTQKNLDNVSVLSKVPNLESLNLAFNNLRDLEPLRACNKLHTLNIMHNKAASLRGVGACWRLRYLRCSNNAISDLEELSHCTGLQELWMQNNKLADLAQLSHLRSLKQLRRLVLKPNPCANTKPEGLYRHYLIHNFPSLEVLDMAPISEDDREEANAFFESREGARLFAEIDGRAAAMAAARQEREEAEDKENAGAAPEEVAAGALKEADAREPKAAPAAQGPPGRRGPPAAAAAGPRARRQSLAKPAPAAPVPAARRPMSDKGARGATSAAVIKNTASELPTRKFSRRSNLAEMSAADREGGPRDGGAAPAPAALAAEKEGGGGEFVLKYRKGSQGCVSIRPNGTGVARWPNNTLAVSVDEEDGGHRIYAAYKSSGAVAVSFDCNGNGYVNFPNGNTFFTHNARHGGMLLGDRLEILEEWQSDADGRPAGLAGTIERELDEGLRFVYKMPEHEVQVHFECQGVAYKFVKGLNPAAHTLEPSAPPPSPPRGGGDASPTRPLEERLASIRSATSNILDFDGLRERLASGSLPPARKPVVPLQKAASARGPARPRATVSAGAPPAARQPRSARARPADPAPPGEFSMDELKKMAKKAPTLVAPAPPKRSAAAAGVSTRMDVTVDALQDEIARQVSFVQARMQSMQELEDKDRAWHASFANADRELRAQMMTKVAAPEPQ